MADQVLDPEALTIGFARRFATYKRGTLLLRDPERLKKLLDDTKRPIQFLFAGKAHPADHEGKELIKRDRQFRPRRRRSRRRIVFLENYDINVARYLVQGVDVWLNTPRRAVRGQRHQRHEGRRQRRAQLLDSRRLVGRGIRPDLGWAIGRGENYTDTEYQDHVESQALYDLLEKQIIPLFYNRGVDNIPREWIGRMKNCMRKLAPVFNTNRMVPRIRRAVLHSRLGSRRTARRRRSRRPVDLAHAKDDLRHKWSGIRIVGVHTTGNGHFKVGETMQVEAMVDLPGIKPEELTVQLYCRPDRPPSRRNRTAAGSGDEARQAARSQSPRFVGKIDCRTSGRQGFAVRILPGNADLATPFEPGLIVWN